MNNKEIIFYKRENGKIPVHEFLDNLTKKHRIKALRSLQLLEEFGNELTEPDTREVRCKNKTLLRQLHYLPLNLYFCCCCF